ncbi:MAG: hypothetical protein AAGJ31_13395, partial [Verrucomicrobiota bacterium]
MEQTTSGRWWRRGTGMALLAGSIPFLLRGDFTFLVGLLFCAVGGAFLLPELLAPAFWLVDLVFGTGSAGGKPPLDLRKAEFYVKEARWEEAGAEYIDMLSHHPHSFAVYRGLLTHGR